MRWSQRCVIALLGLIALATGWLQWISHRNGCTDLGAKIVSEIRSRRTSAQAQPISLDLASTIDGDWERVCIFGPYTSRERIDAALGLHWDCTAAQIDSDDSNCLLVFLARGSVMGFAKVPRGECDFFDLGDAGKCFSRDDAVFTITTDPSSGWKSARHSAR